MYFVFDIGGTKTRVAISTDGIKLEKIQILATPPHAKTGSRILAEIAKKLAGGKKLKAVAGGLAGSFDRRKTTIVGGGSNIKGWMGKNLKKEMGRAFGAPVYLENDAALAGLAEAKRGAGRGKEIAAYLTWSTGIGGARILRGKIDTSARGFEPGHQVVDAGESCQTCKGKHLEAHLSGRAIEKHFGKKPEKINDSRVWDRLTRWFAIALNNTIVYWSPDVVILGGSVMKSIDLGRLRKHLRNIYRQGSSLPPPTLRRAKLGDHTGLYGALELIRQHKYH